MRDQAPDLVRPDDARDEPVALPRGAEADVPQEASKGIGSRLDSVVRGAGRRLRDAFPRFERPLRVCRETYASAYVRSVRLRHNATHAAPIDPYRVFWVDPARIEYVAEPTGLSRFQRAGSVMGGDWDRSELRFVDTDVYRAFEARFRHGVAWEDTAFFERVVEEIADGAEPWRCSSRAAFERRCRELDRLYESIRENGFKTQRELAASEGENPLDRRRGTLAARIINDEIAVDIGRDGALFYSDGRNRLALAKVLDVDSIPVIVLRRHAQWVTFRDAAATYLDRGGTLPSSVRDHPDLRPLYER